MTIEQKVVVGLEDIQAICFECLNNDCRAIVSISPDKFERIPARCEQCGQQWAPQNLTGFQDSKPWVFTNFASSLKTIRTLMNSGSPMGFRVLLEFKETQ
jgi:hypothetical protein